MICNKCGNVFVPIANKTKRGHICILCYREYQKQWRKRRQAEGLPVRGECSQEWWAAYWKEYYQRPEVKNRKAKQMVRYAKDPRLRLKHEARWALNKAVLSGKTIKKPCESCGSPESEGHHPDYTKPLEVMWLCRACHTAIHAKAEGKP